MKLTIEQIKNTYAFTYKNGVRSYELQTELVDHLANGIEEQWNKQPSLKFDVALEEEFNKFGPTGFEMVIKEHFKAVQKRMIKSFLRYFVEYFTTSKFLIVLLSSIMVYLICNSDYSIIKYYFTTSIFAVCALIYPVFCVLLHETKVRSQLFNEKRWSLKKMVLQTFSGLLLIALLPNAFYSWVFYSTKGFSALNNGLTGLFSFIFVLICLCTYIFLVKLPQEFDDNLKVALS
ncbi:hypothetical protein LX97_02116 [Nonlabens dokdonensis]|jgi:hypothetical protein|uniref:Uncharacterized protein n=2 Tax=Nonlabens dokdonensis TaxID=328515 RepID=L7WC77_NONDD|nr:hypothetical protein [Nonlabens dokdonensis]AGC77704.1 hypothetical protein DDD_2577 [Nonlabens dokdonensis DSW-6]PZX39759.1 hypothetical protein LX97_02116 [Nonlabens dokdonensis]